MGEFYGREEEIKNYILACWREALYLYNHGQTYLSLPLDVSEIADRKQEGVVEDDPKVGLIREYLDNQEVGYKVCCLELFTKCLNGIKKNYDRSASRDIGRILNNIPGWERGEKPARLQDYGVQKYWEKME